MTYDTVQAAKKRNVNLDVLRTLAIVFVVLNHATEIIYRVFPVSLMSSLSLKSKLFAYSGYTLGRIGVPVFLILSGFLLLGKKYDSEKRKRFWKKNLLSIFITVEIWYVLFCIFDMLYYEVDFDLKLLIYRMLFLKSSSMCQMWYIPMILGMYVFIPYISNALEEYKPKNLAVPLVIGIVVLMVLPVANSVLLMSGEEEGISSILNVAFTGGAYGIYIVFGWIIKKEALRRIKTVFLLTAGIASFICVVLILLYSCKKDYQYNLWYNNVFLLICSVCIFELVLRIGKPRLAAVFTNVSRCSFGIFLMHIPFMTLGVDKVRAVMETPAIKENMLYYPFGVAMIFLVGFVPSLIISNLVKIFPKVSKVLLNVK